jgi:DNA (cytosine-5)-methyltransferase 1
MSFTIGSLFDGSGGFPLAATMCGGTPKWASEIEPYPIAVTKSRFPDMKHLGSITDIKGGEVDPVDVISFGSPCQDLSVAGKRAGLKHEANGDDETTRSGLFMEAVRIIKEMREATNGVYPRFALWENVPGAFSSNKGEDFRIVLEELIKIVEPSAVMPEVPKNGWPYADSYCGDGWSLAYRVLDAQFWGVPQRRRRIYLVADFRGECAGKVSFEREGLRGYFETSRTPWQAVTGDAENCSGAADCKRKCYGIDAAITTGGNCTAQGSCVYEDIQATLKAGGVHGVAYALEPGIAAREGGHIYEDVSGTLRANAGDNQMAVAYSFDSLASNSMKSKNPHSGCRQVEVAKCLDTTDPNPCKNQGGIAVVEQVPYTLKIRSGCEGGGKGALIQTDKSATLSTLNDQYLFQPVGIIDSIGGQAERGWEGEVSPCLKASHYKFAPCVAIPQSVYSIENHPADSRVDIDESGKVQTLTSRMGTGGNVPMVMEPVVFDGANVTSPVNASNPQPGDPCHTLSTDSRNFLVEAVNMIEGQPIPIHDQATRFSGKRGDKSDGKGNGLGVGEPGDNMNTLTAGDRHAVAYCTDVGFFNSQEEMSPTLLARQYKDPHLVTYSQDLHYVVRRLIPTECCRLQGFPDFWGHPDEKTEFTDEEYEFWLNVRNTHAVINDKATKEYTKDQILKWYNGLHTDSSEYKMWGNGIALPNALYMMQGIADVMSEEKAARRKWLDDLLK